MCQHVSDCRVALLLAMTLSLTACGVKGKLKTPSQIQVQEAKKAKKAARAEKAQQKQAEQAAQPAIVDQPGEGAPIGNPGGAAGGK